MTMKKWMAGLFFISMMSWVSVVNSNSENVGCQNNNAIEQQFDYLFDWELFDWALDDEIDISVTLDRLEFICRWVLGVDNFGVYSIAIEHATDLEYFCICGEGGILDQFNALLLDEGASEVDLLFKLADFEVWHRWVFSGTNIGQALRREVRGVVDGNGQGYEQPLADWYQETLDWMFDKIREHRAVIR
jgi:hypothetical protein